MHLWKCASSANNIVLTDSSECDYNCPVGRAYSCFKIPNTFLQGLAYYGATLEKNSHLNKTWLPVFMDIFSGMCSRTTWSRPRPGVFEVKARGLQGQGHKILSSRSRPVLEDPDPWAFHRAMLRRERLCHVVCLSITQIQRPTATSCALVHEVLYLWY